MNKTIKRALLILPAAVLIGLAGYASTGWFDARSDAPALRGRAQALIADGLGPQALGKAKLELLLAVEDPSFFTNNGTDFSTPGAGQTTITQSLSKRLAFAAFKPGLRKIRQTVYAVGLTQRLAKDEILALFFAESSFKGADRKWTKGFDAASRHLFNHPVADLDRDQFATLVAAGLAPAKFAPDAPNAELRERTRRIKRLADGLCKPKDHGDVELEGCA